MGKGDVGNGHGGVASCLELVGVLVARRTLAGRRPGRHAHNLVLVLLPNPERNRRW